MNHLETLEKREAELKQAEKYYFSILETTYSFTSQLFLVVYLIENHFDHYRLLAHFGNSLVTTAQCFIQDRNTFINEVRKAGNNRELFIQLCLAWEIKLTKEQRDFLYIYGVISTDSAKTT